MSTFQIPRIARWFYLSLGIVLFVLAAVFRVVLVKFNLGNNSIEHFLPLTFVAIGVSVIVVEQRWLKALAVLAGVLAIVCTGFLIAFVAVAPFSR